MVDLPVSPNAIFDIHYHQSEGMPMIPTEAHVINPSLYCICKGAKKQEFMVYCESGEDNCINGGWLHPECTNDLAHMTKDEIDTIEIWYCEDCRNQRKDHIAKEHPEYQYAEPIIKSSQDSNRIRALSMQVTTEVKQQMTPSGPPPASSKPASQEKMDISPQKTFDRHKSHASHNKERLIVKVDKKQSQRQQQEILIKMQIRNN